MHGQVLVQVQVLGRVTPNLVDEHFPLCTCTPIDELVQMCAVFSLQSYYSCEPIVNFHPLHLKMF